MSAWKDFLDDVLGPPDQPGKVMICFMNRYLEGLDGIKYKIKYDGKERSGTTTTANYCVEITPKSFKPIETFVWSRKALAYKKLDDVTPDAGGRKKLVRKVMKTFKVDARTEKLNNNARAAKRPSKPTAPPPPGPSPKTPQGVQATQGKDESGQPMVSVSRAVPGQITVEQLKKIFPAANSQHLQSVADECNTDLPKYKLDTVYRRAHFFGQIRQEVGNNLQARSEELGGYRVSVLMTLGYYIKHPKEARQDVGKAEIIANKAYGPNSQKGIELGNREPGDGWLFRGRGMKQTTGRSNYKILTKKYSEIWSKGNDFEESPELLNQMPYSLRSAIVFWIDKNCWVAADAGITESAIDAVTKIVNAGEITNNLNGKYKENANPVKNRRINTILAYAAFS